MSGVQLFQRAEMKYFDGDARAALDLYAQAIRKIIKNEDVTQILPAVSPDPAFPHETLPAVWRNFVGFFRDHTMGFTAANVPDAYKLLDSFRPSSEHSELQQRYQAAFTKRSPRGPVIYKGMQIAALVTLGIMAWDSVDRPRCTKRYSEALALAETYAPFVSAKPPSGLELYVALDVKQARDNLNILIESDKKNAALLGNATVGRKETRDIPKAHVRVEPDGRLTALNVITFATDVCHACGKRDAKLSKCSKCKKVTYCGRECQLAHWPTHKGPCKTTVAEEKESS